MDGREVWRGRTEARAAALALGLTAVTGQTVLLRVVLARINGSEIAVGFLLAGWLVWTAAGSAGGGWLAGRMRSARALAAAGECAMGVGLGLGVGGVHACRMRWAATPGELLGPDKTLAAAFLCVSLFCVGAGACFAALTKMARSADEDAGKAASRVYLYEAVGAGVGGVLAALVLVRWLGAMQIAALVLAGNLTLAALMLVRWSWARAAAMVSVGACAAVGLMGWVAPRVEQQMRAREWPGFTVVDARESQYGSLTLIESNGVRSLYENGALVANAPDPEAAEEAVHFALLEHAAPRRVLLVGGAAEGAVAEALRHPTVERVDVVELDPELLRVVHERLKEVGRAVFHDHRVKVHVGDGRKFVTGSGESWDAIIVVGPDAETSALNRFYTEEFFRAARARLAAGGVFSIAARSSEEAMTPELREYLQSMQKTLDAVFPDVVAIPGGTMHFVAAARTDELTDHADVLIRRLQERKLSTQYVREYFLPYRMSAERMEEARAQLAADARTRVNRDFQPVAYYENAVLWSGEFRPTAADWLRRAARVPLRWVLGTAAFLSLVAMLFGLRGKQSAARVAMGSTGFTTMAAQVFLLLGFQAVRGYLYQELALLVGLTMAGMALGSAWAMRRERGVAQGQILLAALLPPMVAAMSWLGRAESEGLTQAVFAALALLAGALGGAQFAGLAARAVSKDGGGAGALYAVDLAGGAAAALVVSAFLIPVFGFWATAWSCAILGAGPAVAAMRG